MRPSRFLRLCSMGMAVLFLSSCYSEYKVIPGTRTGDTRTISVTSDVEATTIFPFIPKHYSASLGLANHQNKPVCITDLAVTLKRDNRKNERFLGTLNNDSIILKPGEARCLHFEFAKSSPRFFPHKVSLNMTASVRDSSGRTTISQSLQFIRYMYVNVGGD